MYGMQWLSNEPQLHETTHYMKNRPKVDSDGHTMLGEFCVFASELARFCEQGAAVPMSTSRPLHSDGKDTNYKTGSKRMAYEVFLGGSCNPTTWRSEIAIPTLQRLGITYYNPQVSEWRPELIAQEYEAKQTARVLFFVIDNQTRNSAGIIEAAQLAATRSDSLILVIYPYRLGQTIFGETISTQEYYDLMNGLLVLQYLMEKQRLPIFENVSVALNCISKIIREKVSVQELHAQDGIRTTRISLNQHDLDLTILKEIFKSLDVSDTGSISLGEALVTLQKNTKCSVPVSNLVNVVKKSKTYKALIENFSGNGDPAEQRINFEQFCAIASEGPWRTKNNGANCEISGWSNSFIPDTDKRDLYIGAVGKDQSWLESSAAPLIASKGLSLHRMSLNEYNIRTLPQELQRINDSQLILLIVPQHSRGTSVMTLAAYLVGLRAKLVLCVQTLPEGSIVSGEKLTEQAMKDYNRGRMYLSDYATREGVPVFPNVADALQHAMKLVQSPR